MRSITVAVVLTALVGCQTTHLRYNTVEQAKSLSQIYEQQVMDNLAMFVHDAHALPFFAYPKDGSANISDQATVSASPLRDFEHVLGITGRRSGLTQWGLTPISDPDKLALMQCAYQKAIYGTGITVCQECCKREKKFEGKPDVKVKVLNPINGIALTNPETCSPYCVEVGDLNHPSVIGVYRDTISGKEYEIDRQGRATIENYDCYGPCTIQCGWICYGKKCDAPKDKCAVVGHHCGTYVWVKDCHRHHLTRLTLKILDYAVNDAPVAVPKTKEVRLWVDKYGRPTHDRTNAIGRVSAIIGINEQISSIVTLDDCAIWHSQTAEQRQAARERAEAEQELCDIRSTLMSEGKTQELEALEQFLNQHMSGDLEPFQLRDSEYNRSLSDRVNKATQNLDRIAADAQIAPAMGGPESDVFLIEPRRPSLDGILLDQFEIQRQQRALLP